MNASDTQVVLFTHIRSKLPGHLSLVDQVAELLNISNDSAYRRIRGEKPLGLDEIQILCNKYQVSLDQLLHIKNNTVIFSGNNVDSVSFGFNEYLRDIIKNLELFNSLSDSHIYFYNKDVPIFHFMPFPDLQAFKFFFWKRTLMGYPELARQQFNGDGTDEESIALGKKIIALYTSIPSTEIWNEENVHSTIRQVEFYRQSNVFNDRHIVVKIYEQLVEMLNHMEREAENGRKHLYGQHPSPNNAAYNIYVNECLIGDNTIFADSNDGQIACLNHNGLNFNSTRDKSFCDYTFKNLQNLIRKSTFISGVGEKERSIFFNILRQKIYDKMP